MAIQFTSEDQIEHDLITQLTEGESQWTYQPDIKSEADLWTNFFELLEQRNVSKLNGVALTDDEKSQIQTGLNFATFYDAGKWLSGENGVAHVRVQRTDAHLGTIYLNVHNSRDIAGGTSTYQVVNQIQRHKQSDTDRNRRTDVTLLINGLPLIHLELKSRAHSITEAFHQIKKYDAEKKFTGLFSLVQCFVVSNGSNTQYIAANKHYNLDATFLTTWVDINNKAVRELYDFTHEVLTIPMGHELVTDYTVLDAKRKALITLRPYQIHATKAILDAMNKDQSGHIWHTTGSGKTLTSYKTAKTILKRNSLDKVLFLVDRKDLDTQTTNEFQSYAENDTIDVEDTANVSTLVTKLLSGEREVIVTTAQKMNHLIKRFEQNVDGLTKRQHQQRDKLRALRLAFVVDECHRAVSADKQRVINRFFRQPVKLWYGFTGTPIFIPKKVAGDLPSTTLEQYGPALHTYTVKEAIHDHNVLPFHVEYVDTLEQDTVVDYLEAKLGFLTSGKEVSEEKKQAIRDTIANMTQAERENGLDKDLYEYEEHMLKVIEQIINRSRTKLGLNRGPSNTFGGVLTVSSIAVAQEYYTLFKRVLNGDIDKTRLSERVRKLLSDFPRIAITYSLSENDERSVTNHKRLGQAIADYNNHFNTRFTLETVDAYNRNLGERLARKKEKYQIRSEQLDLVIVVDRLLTGFDAPSLSTLFIDRPVMPPHDLIQAFSRTNRLFKGKRANIVTMRQPELFRQAVQDAVRLYSAGAEPNEVMAPTWTQTKTTMMKAVSELTKVLDEVDDILHPDVSKEKKFQFAKAFRDLDNALDDILVYEDFVAVASRTEDPLLELFGISGSDLQSYHGLYQDVIKQLKKDDDDGGAIINVDVEYELASRYTDEIDYEYILALMDKYNDKDLTSDEEKEVDKYIAELKQANPKLGAVLEKVWNDIKLKNPDVQGKRAIDSLEQEKAKYMQAVVIRCANDWLVDKSAMSYLVRHYRTNRSHQNGWSVVAEQIRQGFDSSHAYPVDQTPNRLTIKRLAQNHIYELIEREIVPLK